MVCLQRQNVASVVSYAIWNFVQPVGNCTETRQCVQCNAGLVFLSSMHKAVGVLLPNLNDETLICRIGYVKLCFQLQISVQEEISLWLGQGNLFYILQRNLVIYLSNSKKGCFQAKRYCNMVCYGIKLIYFSELKFIQCKLSPPISFI